MAAGAELDFFTPLDKNEVVVVVVDSCFVIVVGGLYLATSASDAR